MSTHIGVVFWLVYHGAELSTFFNLLNQSDSLLAEVANGGCTVLAPVNKAFASDNIKQLSADERDALLRYHVIQGVYASEDLSDKARFLPTLLNNASYANVTGGQVVEARMIDGQLNFVSGVWDATNIVTPDIIFNNGIIHSIANVLTIPTELGDTITQAHLTAYIALGEKLGTVTPPDDPYLSGIQIWPDVTILAPNNSHYSTNYNGWDNLTPKGILEVWGYHLINGTAVYSTDFASGRKFQTAEGSDITIYEVDGSTYINNAKVLKSDLLIANGVMQIIDRPLNPNATSAHPVLSDATKSNDTSGLSIGAKAGIGVGVGLAVIILLGCILLWFYRSKKRKTLGKTVPSKTVPEEGHTEGGSKSELVQVDDAGVGEVGGLSRSEVGGIGRAELGGMTKSKWRLSNDAPWEMSSEQAAIELDGSKRHLSELP